MQKLKELVADFIIWAAAKILLGDYREPKDLQNDPPDYLN